MQTCSECRSSVEPCGAPYADSQLRSKKVGDRPKFPNKPSNEEQDDSTPASKRLKTSEMDIADRVRNLAPFEVSLVLRVECSHQLTFLVVRLW